MESNPPTGNDGYEAYYLQVNPPREENYRRKARGYHRRFAALLGRLEPRSVLDLGCGTGMLCKYLVDSGVSQVVGVDLNPALAERAREMVPQAEILCREAGEYARTCERRFDLIFLLDVIEHVPRERVVGLLASIRGLLNDGGALLVRTPNLNSLHAAGGFFVDFTHVTPFTERSLEHVSRMAGYTGFELVPQFRMQNAKGKLKACLNALVIPTLVWLRGGHKVKVFYRNLIALLRP